MLKDIVTCYLQENGLDPKAGHSVDSLVELVASKRGLLLLSDNANNLLPRSVLCRHLRLPLHEAPFAAQKRRTPGYHFALRSAVDIRRGERLQRLGYGSWGGS